MTFYDQDDPERMAAVDACGHDAPGPAGLARR